MKIVKETLSASEALCGFGGWLTTRNEPVIMSSHHEAGIVAELIDEFIKKQDLEDPKDHWEDDLIPMKENIQFERGKDTKEILRIGKYRYTPDDFRYWSFVGDKIGYEFKRSWGDLSGEHIVKLQKKGTKQMLTLKLNINENILWQISLYYNGMENVEVEIQLDDIDNVAERIDQEIKDIKNII